MRNACIRVKHVTPNVAQYNRFVQTVEAKVYINKYRRKQ